jgi:hypothetical protein
MASFGHGVRGTIDLTCNTASEQPVRQKAHFSSAPPQIE